ncbi:homodimeric glycerol 3-phosphate dehydrogenase (quinone) [Tahibacter aquaticus]|uniref:Glycerol-3-phosphate dehydrogenase n=1 Tax=Tahibacter aquaticus TaxID=520092 RepID=A0A4R6Z793_9GAMM|nr:glycerol-3-phosphate dehydrogenase [Tahibacter aquaticus]TDR47670.1 homodimeric glycerol 3-phosphate dehydrogenase (quinone) [Tahibacter aquaticus]
MNTSLVHDRLPVPAEFDVDLLVVGGGINGAGIARDAAGRGLRVLLCEQDDLASHTSSASTKLIHGGLRYLEYYQFALVRKSLREREVLLESAPHLIHPLRFVMPHAPHLRPVWMIRLGLYLYDHLARRRHLAGSATLDLRRHVAGEALQPGFRRGFAYSDGWVDDARLVALVAKDAAERGATVLTRTRCCELQRERGGWRAQLQGAHARTLTAHAVVNASGPWVAQFLQQVAQRPAAHEIRLVRGSHIVVPRLFAHDFAYVFQGEDRRIVFALPYEGEFSLIGTTEVDVAGDPADVHIAAAEVDYLCALANRYFQRQLTAADVVSSYSGVRPLLRDDAASASAVTRDYVLELDSEVPLLSVFGGKITTFRRLAEEAVDLLCTRLNISYPAWTAHACLPGGDMAGADFDHFEYGLAQHYPWLEAALRRRYARAYGSRVSRLLEQVRSAVDLGEEVLPGLYQVEIDYLRREEWVTCAEDLLWRRSKLGLHLPPDAAERLDAWMARKPT